MHNAIERDVSERSLVIVHNDCTCNCNAVFKLWKAQESYEKYLKGELLYQKRLAALDRA